jgi:hypothetical protein
MKRRLIAGILLALATTAAEAQDPRLEARLPLAARASVHSILEQAAAQGLPMEPLVQRALEGASRNSSPERIEEAVRDLAKRMHRAQAALGSEASEAELLAAAGALHAGLVEGDLVRLRTASSGGSLAQPLVTLVDLLQRGVPRDTASAAVLALVQAGVPAEGYAQLRRSVAQDIRQGATPSSAAHTRAQGVLLERRPPARAAPPSRTRPSPSRHPRAPGGRSPR